MCWIFRNDIDMHGYFVSYFNDKIKQVIATPRQGGQKRAEA